MTIRQAPFTGYMTVQHVGPYPLRVTVAGQTFGVGERVAINQGDAVGLEMDFGQGFVTWDEAFDVIEHAPDNTTVQWRRLAPRRTKTLLSLPRGAPPGEPGRYQVTVDYPYADTDIVGGSELGIALGADLNVTVDYLFDGQRPTDAIWRENLGGFVWDASVVRSSGNFALLRQSRSYTITSAAEVPFLEGSNRLIFTVMATGQTGQIVRPRATVEVLAVSGQSRYGGADLFFEGTGSPGGTMIGPRLFAAQVGDVWTSELPNLQNSDGFVVRTLMFGREGSVDDPLGKEYADTDGILWRGVQEGTSIIRTWHLPSIGGGFDYIVTVRIDIDNYVTPRAFMSYPRYGAPVRLGQPIAGPANDTQLLFERAVAVLAGPFRRQYHPASRARAATVSFPAPSG